MYITNKSKNLMQNKKYNVINNNKKKIIIKVCIHNTL